MKEMTKHKYTGSDKYVVPFIEAILLFIFVFSFWKDYFHEPDGTTVARGEKSMELIYKIAIGVVMFIYAVAIQLSEALKGNKVLIFVLNSIALIYLFFFSSWFRNSIFFPLMKRIIVD